MHIVFPPGPKTCGADPYGTRTAADLVDEPNTKRWLAIQIETVETVERVDEIAAVDGVDILSCRAPEIWPALWGSPEIACTRGASRRSSASPPR